MVSSFFRHFFARSLRFYIGPPSQSLGVDPVDRAVMRRPPRKKDEPVISKRILYRVLFSALIMVCGTLFIYLFALSGDDISKREQTMVRHQFLLFLLLLYQPLWPAQTFTCFVFLDLVSALQNRSLACRLTQNRMLIVTVSISFLSQLALIYVPLLQAVFQTEALHSRDLLLLLSLAGSTMAMHEGRRMWERSLAADEMYFGAVQEMA